MSGGIGLRAQRECDADRIERESNVAALRLLEESRGNQRVDVTMDSLHIAFDAPCDLTDGQWSLTV